MVDSVHYVDLYGPKYLYFCTVLNYIHPCVGVHQIRASKSMGAQKCCFQKKSHGRQKKKNNNNNKKILRKSNGSSKYLFWSLNIGKTKELPGASRSLAAQTSILAENFYNLVYAPQTAIFSMPWCIICSSPNLHAP